MHWRYWKYHFGVVLEAWWRYGGNDKGNESEIGMQISDGLEDPQKGFWREDLRDGNFGVWKLQWPWDGTLFLGRRDPVFGVPGDRRQGLIIHRFSIFHSNTLHMSQSPFPLRL